MGKIIFTAIVSDVANKIGDVVFSKNHYGSVVRKRVKPINPRSAAQTAQRTSLRTLSQQWRGLTQLQITAWNYLASSLSHKDKLGVSHTYTGKSIFISCNLNLINNGGAAYIDTPPSVDSNNVNNLFPFTFAVVAGVLTVTWTNSTLATAVVELRSSGPVSAGRTYNSKFKTFFHVPCNVVPVSADISAAYIAQFGALPTTGQVIFIQYRVVDNATGFSSLYEKIRVVGA